MRTLLACGPFCPWLVSNSTWSPSLSDLKPDASMALKWTKTSLLPSSGVIKPKPFASLNHFTVPLAIAIALSLEARTFYTGAKGFVAPPASLKLRHYAHPNRRNLYHISDSFRGFHEFYSISPLRSVL